MKRRVATCRPAAMARTMTLGQKCAIFVIGKILVGEYYITTTHFRDIYGRFLWLEGLQEEHRLFAPGEKFTEDGVQYRVERMAVAENTQHVNLSVIEEDVNITEGPHL